MGSRGPTRTPTVKLAELGSHRAKSRAKKEPQPDTTKPKTTLKLTAAERRVFNNVCKLLKSMNLQAATDGNAIARYAMNLLKYQDACDWCAEHGESYEVFETVKGEKSLKGVRRYPQSQIRNELESTLLRLEREFGLTPSARAGLEVENANTKGVGPASKYLA
jgi:P27 family predicted phage terminase small subunit